MRNDGGSAATLGGIYLLGTDVRFVIEHEHGLPHESVQLPRGSVTTVRFRACTHQSAECGEKLANAPSATQVLLSAGNAGSLEVRLTEPAESLLLLPFQVKDRGEPGFLLTMGILLAIVISAMIVFSARQAIDLEERVASHGQPRARYLISLGPASIEKSWSVWYSAAVGVRVTAALPAPSQLVSSLESPAGLDPLVLLRVVLALPLGFAPLVLANQAKNSAPEPSIQPPEGSYLVSIPRFLVAQFLVISSALGETVLLAAYSGLSDRLFRLIPAARSGVIRPPFRVMAATLPLGVGGFIYIRCWVPLLSTCFWSCAGCRL